MEERPQNDNRQVESQSGNNPLGSLMLFNRNAHFAYIYKKTEKLVTAVYMITNFIKDNEPLKWKVRENALELMALNIAFNTVSLSERRDLIREYQAYSLEIVSLAGIAHHSGLISEMNYLILSREFSSLVATIEKDENKKANEETVILDPGFFEVSPAQPDSPGAYPGISRTNLPQKDVLYPPYPTAPQKEHTTLPAFVTEASRTAKPEYLPLKDIAPKTSKSADSKEGRQAVIIKLLSKKGGLNVNDFSDSIKGVSAKTIQRELLAMVASGVLKKEGERRWSTYSLAR